MLAEVAGEGVGRSQGFDHMTVVVTDLAAAKDFFAVLGFEEEKSVVVSSDVMSGYMGMPDFEADHVTLVLKGVSSRQEVQLLGFHNPPVAADAGSGDLGRTGFSHVCFRVEDLDATVAAFGAVGATPRNHVMDFHDRRLVFMNGPAGVVVELAEWKTDPPIPGSAL
jgi:catechol 2,3-dioxygenase-like lactoylglutathione lyase family enzyme